MKNFILFFSILFLNVSCSNHNENIINKNLKNPSQEDNIEIIKNLVLNDLTISPNLIDFGNVQKSTGVYTKSVLIKNTSAEKGKISVDTNIQNFTIDNNSSCLTNNNYKVLDPNQYCELKIIFNSSSTGSFNSAVNLHEIPSNNIISTIPIYALSLGIDDQPINSGTACKDGSHQEGRKCISNIRTQTCSFAAPVSSLPEFANYNNGNTYTQNYSLGSWSSTINSFQATSGDCSFQCNAGYDYNFASNSCTIKIVILTRVCSPQPSHSYNGLESSSDNGTTWSACENYTCENNYSMQAGVCIPLQCDLNNYYSISSIIESNKITGISGSYPNCIVSSCSSGYKVSASLNSCEVDINYCSAGAGDSIAPIYKGINYDDEMGPGSATYMPIDSIKENPNNSTELMLDNTTFIDKATGIFKSKVTLAYYGYSALARYPDGRILLGYTNLYYYTSNSYLIRLNADGSVDNTFTLGLGFNAGITALAIQPDGKIIVGGNFTGFQGMSANKLIRLNENGTRDTSFVIGTGFYNGGINTILVQPNGQIMLGGSFFSTYNEANIAPYIIRLNENGSRDSTFNASYLNDEVTVIKMQSDGKYVVAGRFTTFNGVAANRLIRFTSTGSKDATFTPGTALGTTASFSIKDLFIEPNGKIFIYGTFSQFNGTFSPGMVRLLSTGVKDTTFVNKFTDPLNLSTYTVQTVYQDPSDSSYLVYASNKYNYDGKKAGFIKISSTGSLVNYTTSVGFDGPVLAVKEQSDGKVIYAGLFTSYNGVKAPGIIRLNQDTSIDTAFTTANGTGFNGDAQPGVIEILPNGKILIGGSNIKTFNGVSRLNGLVALTSTGALDTVINPTFNSGYASIYTIYVYPDTGSFILGGSFQSPTQQSECSRTCRLSQSGVIDTTWRNATYQTTYINLIKRDAYGNFLMGGARAASGSSFIRLSPTGALDTSFTYTRQTSYTLTFEILPDNTYLIGNYGGNGEYNAIYKIWPDGTVDTSYVSDNNTGTVYSMFRQPNGKILIVDTYSQAIRRLNANGSLDNTFLGGTPTFTDESYHSSAPTYNFNINATKFALINGKVIITGTFTRINNKPLYYISYLLENQCLPGYINYSL